MPTALTYTYCSSDDISAFLSTVGKEGRVDDDNSGTLTATETGYITSAISWATDRINFFLFRRYDPACLNDSWLVNQWAVILACYWLSSRRGNPPPGSFGDLYKEAIEDLKKVHNGQFDIPNVGEREAGWPAWSNVRVDMLYQLRKLRVETRISEREPVNYNRARDWGSEFISAE